METQNKVIRGRIYKITNIANGMCYIGKTTYNDIQKRFVRHKYYALMEKGGTEKTLHQAIRDFGVDNFKIEEVETVKAPQFLENREKYWIAYYHSWIGDPKCNGYNQSRGGEGTHYSSTDFGDYLSDSIIQLYKRSQNQSEVARQLGIDVTTVRNYLRLNNITPLDARTVAINTTGKKVAVYYDNELLAVYPSMGQANEHIIGNTKQDVRHISEICNGKSQRKTVRGYTFKFTDQEVFNEDLYLENKSNKLCSSVTKKGCQMIDIETGEVINTFESGCEAGRYFKMERPSSATTCIRRAVQRDGTWRGYKWRRI